jgi:hypothetical protein
MTTDDKLVKLEQACQALGVAVSYESLTASVGLGGLCRVKGKYRVIIEKRASPQERAVTLAEALSRLDLGSLSPELRRLVGQFGVRRAS